VLFLLTHNIENVSHHRSKNCIRCSEASISEFQFR